MKPFSVLRNLQSNSKTGTDIYFLNFQNSKLTYLEVQYTLKKSHIYEYDIVSLKKKKIFSIRDICVNYYLNVEGQNNEIILKNASGEFFLLDLCNIQQGKKNIGKLHAGDLFIKYDKQEECIIFKDKNNIIQKQYLDKRVEYILPAISSFWVFIKRGILNFTKMKKKQYIQLFDFDLKPKTKKIELFCDYSDVSRIYEDRINTSDDNLASLVLQCYENTLYKVDLSEKKITFNEIQGVFKTYFEPCTDVHFARNKLFQLFEDKQFSVVDLQKCETKHYPNIAKQISCLTKEQYESDLDEIIINDKYMCVSFLNSKTIQIIKLNLED